MNEQDYLKTRLHDQLSYFEKKSSHNQKWYRRLKLLTIILSVSIPFVTVFIDELGLTGKVIIGLIGISIALIEGIQQLYQFQENWMNYRKTAEALKREEFLFKTQAGPYLKSAHVQKLAERVETILQIENQQWADYSHTEAELAT